MNNGELGERIAKQLWPELIPTEPGGVADRNGIDGFLFGKKIQIKYDSMIAKTCNIYLELYEKSVNRSDQEWRTSKVNADSYIFVTTDKAYLITVNDIVCAIRELASAHTLQCRAISETSIGFLIPLDKVFIMETKEK